MQFVVWIETVIAGKSVAVQRVAAVERNGVNASAELGLTLEDGKTILNGIEQDIIQAQVDIQSGFCRACEPGIAAALKQLDVGIGEFILEKMPRVRYQMWNGRWHAAVTRMHEIYRAAKTGLKVESAIDTQRLQRFRRHLFELKEYLRNNWKNLTNYAHADRHGLRISSALAVNVPPGTG
jgi:hypothetical protein